MSPSMLCDLWRAIDFILLGMVSMTAICLYDMPDGTLLWRYGIVSACGAVAGVAAIDVLGGYEFATLRRRAAQIAPVFGGWAVAVAAIALGLFFLKIQGPMSRVWLAAWYVGGSVAVIAARLALATLLRHWTKSGRLERRVVIVGGGPAGEEVINQLQALPDCDLRICGVFDDRSDRRSPSSAAGVPKLGNIRELVAFVRASRVDMLIVTLPITAEKRVLELMNQLWVLPVDIRLVFQRVATDGKGEAVPYSTLGEVALLNLVNKPVNGWDAVAKRLFDFVVASLALVLLMPVMIATALTVRLDTKGPILFRQKRHGFNNQIIEVLKFRSMHQAASDPAASKVVTRDDPRVTRVGRFIRRTSLDELPQLWNVLRGELSLVGPRPHAVHALSSAQQPFIEIVDGYFGRHKVKPGITGLAQINGYRGEIDRPEKLRKRFEYDLAYIETWSLMLDAKILLKTPLSLVKASNAY